MFWVLLWQAEDGSWRCRPSCCSAWPRSPTTWTATWPAASSYSTRFGRLVDPLADRLLIDSAVLGLWLHGRLSVARARPHHRARHRAPGRPAGGRGPRLRVVRHLLGKTATAMLMLGLGLIMLPGPDHRWPVYVFDVGLILALAAGVIYVITVRGRLRVERGTGAAA